MISFYELKSKVIKKANGQSYIPTKVAVVNAGAPHILASLKEMETYNVLHPILVGDKKLIEESNSEIGLSRFDLIDVKSGVEAANVAVKLVNEKKADILFKGDLYTDIFLKAVLNKEYGLRASGKVLSHAMVFEDPNPIISSSDGKKVDFFAITDTGMNVVPTLSDKVGIINNTVDFFKKLGVLRPKVAILSAIEKINVAIPGSLDASALTVMGDRGQIKDADVFGPISFDLAFSEEARKIKHFENKISGRFDIYVVNDVVCGNILGKTLTYAAKYKTAGLVLGGASPIILDSRSSSSAERINSIILGVILCHAS